MIQEESAFNDQALAADLQRFRRYVQARGHGEALDIVGRDESAALFRDSLRSALAHIRLAQAPRDAAGSELHFSAGYLERMVPNALADRLEGRHFLAMNSALFVAVQEFAMFCFTQRDVFPDIGDPALESSPKPLDNRVPGLWLLDHTKHGGRVEERHGQIIVPRCDKRYYASIYLGLLMARFVWLHEFQHCFHGHVRFVQDTGRALYLNEIEEPVSLVGAKKPRVRTVPRDGVQRGLELDADRNAFWTCCRVQLDARENIEGIAALDLEVRVRLALFGMYAMTWLFEEFQNYLDAKEGLTHPAPYLRLQNLVVTAIGDVQPLHERFEHLNRDACGQFDAMQQSIPSIYGSEDLYRGATRPDIQDTLDEHWAALSSVSKALEPLRYYAYR